MNYILVVGEICLYQLPNLTWEYIKAYFFPTKRKKIPRSKLRNVFEKYKDELEIFAEGSKRLIAVRNDFDLPCPTWLDEEKLKRGQKMARSYYLSICYSNLISLFLLFAHDKSLRSLILTRKSDTVESAFIRYMSTIHRVKSWYEGDLTDSSSQARKHIRTVNRYHLAISSKLNSMDETEFNEKSTLDPDQLVSDKESHVKIRKVVEMNNVKADDDLTKIMDGSIHLSQTHMAVTQFGFMGLVVLYPSKFGVDEKELDSFIHMWLYIGYLLGIEDEYNLCKGSIHQVKRRCEAVLDCIIKPSLLEVRTSWEHMSLCAFHGINKAFKHLIFQSTLAFLLYCIELDFDYFYESMSFDSKLRFYFNKVLFGHLMTRKCVRTNLNRFVIQALNKQLYYTQYATS